MNVTAAQIIQTAPSRFRPEKANGIDAVFHFELTGDSTILYTLRIHQNTCKLEAGLIGNPKCIVKTSQKLYVELETGKANPQMALMMGKIKVSNLTEMMGFAKLFRKFDESYINSKREQESTPQVNRPILNGPLKGVRILDFSRLLPGPLATMFLADMGAEVLKIEDPDNPDYVRNFEPMIEGTSAFYYALNRNKKSLAVNFLHPEGKKLIEKIVPTVDVVIEQYRPGVMTNFGFGYEQLKAINPKIIYVSITGYGQTSKLAQTAGHDLNYMALSGVLSTIGNSQEQITIPGVQIADIAGGSYMGMNAILAALYQREKTGEGQHIDLSMTDAVLPLIAMQYAEFQATGKTSKRGEFQLAGGLANYNVYKTKDAKFIALGSLEPKFWNKVCELIEKPEWANEILGDLPIQRKIEAELQSLFQQKTQLEWLQFFEGKEVCVTAINDLADLENDPHIIENKLLVNHKIGGKDFKTIKAPVSLSGMEANENWIAPSLGEDSRSLLLKLGINEKEINTLLNNRVIK